MKYEIFLIDFKASTAGRFIRVPRVARRVFSTEVGTVRCNATDYAGVKHALTRSQNATLSRKTKHADQAIQFLIPGSDKQRVKRPCNRNLRMLR